MIVVVYLKSILHLCKPYAQINAWHRPTLAYSDKVSLMPYSSIKPNIVVRFVAKLFGLLTNIRLLKMLDRDKHYSEH
jgi:hypothetical protein